MATKNEQALQAQIDELSRRLSIIEQAPIPQLQEAQKRSEQDRIWYAARAIVEIADPAERAAALLAADFETRRMYWEHAASDPAAAYQTARHLPAGQRAEIISHAPQTLRDAFVVEALPAPPRVRIYLREDVTSWSSSAIKGPTKAEDYPGVRLTSRTRPTTEGGAVEKVYTAQVFDQMLAIDRELADAITRGVVVVEDITETESRRMLAIEIAQLSPHERPRIRW